MESKIVEVIDGVLGDIEVVHNEVDRSGDPLVMIDRVHKSFGDNEVLRGVSLEVFPGEVVCIVGPSGSGKSTLLRCINALESTSLGSISVGGIDVTHPDCDIDAVRRHIGMVFQHFHLFDHLTVLGNCTLAQRRVLRRSASAAREIALHNLKTVGLTEKASAHPNQLSGGQQQRVAIARALCMDPALILCDEPTSALDPELVGEVLGVLRTLARQGMTMIVVTHEMSFALEVADRVVVMDAGSIVEMGPAKQVLTDPRQQRTKQFLSRVLPPSAPQRSTRRPQK